MIPLSIYHFDPASETYQSGCALCINLETQIACGGIELILDIECKRLDNLLNYLIKELTND